MATRVDPTLLRELKDYGAVGIEKCFNCGNCTAICPLASTEHPFPRNIVRRAQLGLRDRLQEMLTAQYDWTGLARRFYTSKLWEIGAVFAVSLFVFLMFALFHGPIVTDHVALNTFAPAHIIEIADWIVLVSLSFFLLTNVYNMYRLTILQDRGTQIPLKLYFTEGWQLIYQAVTQDHFSKCDGDGKEPFWRKPRWRNHWLLVSGYVLMFTLIVVFLRWFQTDNLYPVWNPQRWLGYYATIVLVFGAGDALWGRIVRDHQMHRYSHPSDWMFPILLLLTALSGIAVHTFRYLGLPLPTYWAYVAHLCILTPMLVLEVPFGKWSHLAYRPVAIYFQSLQNKATERVSAPEGAVAAAD
jgi:ferredoxin